MRVSNQEIDQVCVGEGGTCKRREHEGHGRSGEPLQLGHRVGERAPSSARDVGRADTRRLPQTKRILQAFLLKSNYRLQSTGLAVQHIRQKLKPLGDGKVCCHGYKRAQPGSTLANPCGVLLGNVTDLLHFHEGLEMSTTSFECLGLPPFHSHWKQMFMVSRMILSLPGAFDFLRLHLSSLDSAMPLRFW